MSNNSKNQTIIMVAPLGKPDKRVRLAKTISLFHDYYSCDIEFWGWKRIDVETMGEGVPGVTKSKTLVKGGGYRSKYARLLYLYWIARVFFYTLIKAPPRMYCLGLETALPVWMASRFRRKIKYIFDDADRLVLIWSLPKIVERILIYLEKKVSRDSSCHIIPSKERYNYKTNKQYEITNSPNESQIIKAHQNKSMRVSKGFEVYVNGWLDPTRGLDLINKAAEILLLNGRTEINFNVAVGNLTDQTTNFFEKENVNYLGSLTHIQSLEQYKLNDVVLTFYDPSIRINQYAIPNKWGDAIAMGTPIIVNEGVKTAQSLLDAGAAFSTLFSSPNDLADLLLDLYNQPQKLSDAKDAILTVRPNYRSFNDMMAPVLKEFIDNKSQ